MFRQRQDYKSNNSNKLGEDYADDFNVNNLMQSLNGMSIGSAGEDDDYDGNNVLVDFTDEDMNDPALLAELQLLSGGDDTAASAAAFILQEKVSIQSQVVQSRQIRSQAVQSQQLKQQRTELSPEQLQAVINSSSGGGGGGGGGGAISDNDDVHVQVTDEDLNDHQLLAELHALTGHPIDSADHEDEYDAQNSQQRHQQEFHHIKQQNQNKQSVQQKEVPAQTLEPSVEDDDSIPLEMKLQCKDVQVMTKYVRLEKVKAAQQNQSGDKVAARLVFQNYKQLEQRLQELSSSVRQISTVAPGSNSVQDGQSSVKPSVDGLLIQELQERQRFFKSQAIRCKKLDDIQGARDMLQKCKLVEQFIQQARDGQKIDMSKVPSAQSPPNTQDQKKLPQPPPKVPQKQSNTDSVKSNSNSNLQFVIPSADNRDLLQQIRQKLKDQIELCTQASQYYLKNGDKGRALEFHKYKKDFNADLIQVESELTKQDSRYLPQFYYRQIRLQYNRLFTDLSLQDLELKIVRATGLDSKEVSPAQIDSFISWDIGDVTGGDNAVKGDTPVVRKTQNPQFDFIKVARIERNKSFQRYVERKKMNFDLYHYRGFLRKSALIGRAQLKLDQLLSESMVYSILPLIEGNSKRETGATLEVQVRLRQPVLKPDIVTLDDKWLFIGDYTPQSNMPSPKQPPTSSTSTALSPDFNRNQAAELNVDSQSKSLNSASSTMQKSSSGVSPASANTSISSTAAVSPKTGQSQSARDDQLLEQLIEQFDNIEAIVSNNVLEMLQTETIKAIAEQRSTRSGKSVDDLNDLKQRVDLKMNLLVIQVQTGQLTMERYLAQLKQSIEDHKQMALRFKQLGNLDYARKALARVKVMQSEYEEASQQG
ncbi:hypothetical protein MIR68_005902 [Amoeboaphelidium protococcarum]|nr:hypothetical protein MIR68_005902 [Amoeboaphelidium protococcarum]